jgi:hypothetical protein
VQTHTDIPVAGAGDYHLVDEEDQGVERRRDQPINQPRDQLAERAINGCSRAKKFDDLLDPKLRGAPQSLKIS